MLTTQFVNALVCDSQENEYENNIYYSIVLYTDGKLYRVSCDKDNAIAISKHIGKFATVGAEMSTYDGKNRFKLQNIKYQGE